MAASKPVVDYAAAQAVEYGTYVAVAVITVDGVRAFNVGDSVPISNVEAHGYLDAGLVRPTTPLDPAQEG